MQKAKTEGRGSGRAREALVAADLMTANPRTILDTASVAEAIEVLEELDVRHLPVVDSEGNLVGMLSDRDLRPLATEQDEEGLVRRMRTPVVDLMTGGVVSVVFDTDVREIIELMLDHRIGAVPVVDGEGQIVGIVSYVDILRTLLKD